MALERFWRAIPPVNVISQGPSRGSLTVQNSSGFKVGMEVVLKAPLQNDLFIEIKLVDRDTLYFGKIGAQNQILEDVTAYANGTVESHEQLKKIVPEKDQSVDRYERGPTNADRAVLVDSKGEYYSLENPVPIEGDVVATIPDVITSNINFIRNGFTQPVEEDTNNPANNVPLPVKLTGVQGDVIINAENLNLETQTEGVYNSSTNPNPDNVGLILHSRGTGLSDANQILRQTGKIGTTDTNTISADVSIHDGQGNCYSTSNPLPVSGTVNIGTIPEVEIKNDTGNPVPVSGTVNIGTLPVVTVENINGDAFGRTRVSELFTLGDYMHDYGPDSDTVSKVLNGGTVTYPLNKACSTLSTSSNVASYAAQQTKAYHHYQPGKSQLIFSSICFGYAQRNVTKRNGYFDDRDGIYFEQVGSDTSNGTDNGQLNFVIRSFTGGSASEAPVGSYLRRVPQSQWNIDKCDGTGLSGFNINTSKTVLFYSDFQWLGVGRVRCGFVHNGKIVVAHEYYHSNVLNTVYLTNPNLPIRCEILNTGITAGGSMDQICATVCSEGGYIENGADWSVISGLRTTATPGGTNLPIIALRLKNSFNGYPNRSSVRLNNLGFYADANSIVYRVIKIPNSSDLTTTLNAGVLTWTSVNANSSVEYCVNATSCSLINSENFMNGFVPTGSSQNSLSFSSQSNLTSAKKNVLFQNLDSTDSEVYVVLVSTISNAVGATSSVNVAVQWREIF